MIQLAETGYVRQKDIIGDKTASPPIPAIIPISKSTLWSWVNEGKFPKPVKLGPRCTAWKVEDVRAFIEKYNQGEVA